MVKLMMMLVHRRKRVVLIVVYHMVEIDNSAVGISATLLYSMVQESIEYRAEWVDVDDAQ